MSDAASQQTDAFAHIARPLEYRPLSGGAWIELRGLLRKPTAEELAGGMDRETRLVTFRYRELAAAAGANTPRKGDRIREPNASRSYTVQAAWETRWAGPNPTFSFAEVSG